MSQPAPAGAAPPPRRRGSAPDPASAALLSQEIRTVHQFHYKNWPDHDVPSSIDPILELISEIRCYQPDDSIPVCVHCRWVSRSAVRKGCRPPGPLRPRVPGGARAGGSRRSLRPSSSRRSPKAEVSSQDSLHGRVAGGSNSTCS